MPAKELSALMFHEEAIVLSDSIIDQRRMTQARIDALFAGKISAEAFLRARRSNGEPNVGSDQNGAGGGSTCLAQSESGKAFS